MAIAWFPVLAILGAVSSGAPAASAPRPALDRREIEAVEADLVKKFGTGQEERIRRGVRQAASLWWETDGDARAFRSFCRDNFLAEPAGVERAFARIQDVLEQADGHLHELRRFVTAPIELDTGPVTAVDALFNGFDPSTHVDEDLFRSKVAFLALLNFPVHTLEERLRLGPGWDRETWARSRMMDRFFHRVPAPVAMAMVRAEADAGRYVDSYNIRMDRLVTAEGKRLFPEGLRLISHWGLRDELKAWYGRPGGLQRQRTIQRVMERIVRQEIPRAVVDNPDLLWCPETNEARVLSGGPAPEAAARREPDTRYARLLAVFHAAREADPYFPTAPTYPERRFELDRQIPRRRVEELLVSVLDSPEVRRTAQWVRSRLGRPLEPFDIWYAGFGGTGGPTQDELDWMVRARYPDRAAFQADLPRILEALGFAPERARWVAKRIVVDPARGAGHADGPERRGDDAHLRTRIGAEGMDYKGFNIAIHELGHNVEQVFSIYGMDHWFLHGVPNNAFTEALAFLFQDRDRELLGAEGATGDTGRGPDVLRTLWEAYEIGGVSLVDMKTWDWMYAHPSASPAELREATIGIARDVWNRHFAPVFGVRDREILAIYSHMLAYPLYLADYPVGHIIAFQLGRTVRGKRFGTEFERVARQGRITPDAWMRGAVGEPLSARALLEEAGKALDELRGRRAN